MKVSSNLAAILVVLLVSSVAFITSSYKSNSTNDMNACGVYFNQSEDDFKFKFKHTMIDGIYSIDIKTSPNGKVDEVYCVVEMNNKEDASMIFTNTICYIYTTQEGITKTDDSLVNYCTFVIDSYGYVTVKLIDNIRVEVKFIKIR